jgi:hypothetical protein
VVDYSRQMFLLASLLQNRAIDCATLSCPDSYHQSHIKDE